MLNKVLLDTLDHSDCIDDVLDEVGKSLTTVGIWANNKYSNVCNELDDANRIIVQLKDELDSYYAKSNCSEATINQYEYEIKGLETTIATNRDREMCTLRDYNDLYTRYQELETKHKQLNDTHVERRRYDAMLTDYIDLVSKVKDGTALEYIMGLK